MQYFRAQSCAYDNDVTQPKTPLADFTSPTISTRLGKTSVTDHRCLNSSTIRRWTIKFHDEGLAEQMIQTELGVKFKSSLLPLEF